MQSNMAAQKNFSMVPSIGNIQRSVFNRSHTHKTTFNTGDLIPFYIDEILPGDSQVVNANIFARVSSPFIHPIMDNLQMDTFFFFVPNRLLWIADGAGTGSWERFMGQQDNPTDSIDYLVPQVTFSTPAAGELSTYMQVPIEATNNYAVNALHFRAYNLIYNQWFKSQTNQNALIVSTDDGPDDENDYTVQKRLKKHDYFTSCLPTPQRGNPVTIGLIGSSPVIGDGKNLGFTDGTNNLGLYYDDVRDALSANTSAEGDTVGTLATPFGTYPGNDKGVGVSTDPTKSHLIANLAGVQALYLEDLRLATATQQFLELMQRGGTRYVELIKAHFGVINPDYRLQRSEYLGGGSSMVNIHPVTSTNQNTGTPPATQETFLGAQAGFGTMSSRSGYSKAFTEHGVIIGLVNVNADITYSQGLPRMLTRRDRLDFYFPSFANLGEQAVLSGEIWYNDEAADTNVFGYQERWAEYRYFPSRISGLFHPDAAGTLSSWHLSQDFATRPTLGSTFLKQSIPMSRVMTITTQPEIIFDSFIEIRHARPMPVYSVPGLERL